jgi:hypothetical protein
MVKVRERQNKWVKIEAKPNLGFIQIAKDKFVIVKITQTKNPSEICIKD